MKRRELAGQLDLDGEVYVPPEVVKPTRNQPAKKPAWGRLVKRDRTCDLCYQEQHRAYVSGRAIPIRRIARYRRTAPGLPPDLLCHHHADVMRDVDNLPELDHERNGTRA